MSSNWQMDVGLWLRFSRGTISLVRTMGSTGQASLLPSVGGTFGTTEPVAFLEPGKDATYALSPTRMQVSNATNSDLQFFIFFLPQFFVWPSSWPTDNGFTSIGWAWHTQIVQTDNDANSTALGLGESTCGNATNLSDESWVTPLLKEHCHLWPPKCSLPHTQQAASTHFYYFFLVNGWFITTYRNTVP